MSDPTILIIDESEAVYQKLNNYLMVNGYTVLHCFTAEESTNICLTTKINLIIFKIKLESMAGFKDCELLGSHESTSKIPILYLSMKKNTEEIFFKSLNICGCDYMIQKFDELSFIRRIEGLIKINPDKRLKDLEQKLDSLFNEISTIAHQLNQPLTAILGNSELVMRNLDEADKNYRRVNNIFLSAQKMIEYMNDFREFRYAQERDVKNLSVFVLDEKHEE